MSGLVWTVSDLCCVESSFSHTKYSFLIVESVFLYNWLSDVLSIVQHGVHSNERNSMDHFCDLNKL